MKQFGITGIILPLPAFSITIPDDSFWKEQIKCRSVYPFHSDTREYARIIAEGNH